MRALCGALIGIAAVLVAACDSGPKVGELVMELSGPAEALGALSFTVTAAEPNTLDTLTAACGGCSIFTTRVSEREMRGVVTGDFGPGPVVRVAVSDVQVRSAYAGQVLEASAPDYSLLSVDALQLVIP
jgi:hypothetical protein